MDENCGLYHANEPYFTDFLNSKGDNSGPNDPTLLIFNGFRALINMNILCKFEKYLMKTVDCIVPYFTDFFNSRGDNSGLNDPTLLIFHRFRALINMNILCKFEKNLMKTVDCIVLTSHILLFFEIQGEIILVLMI